MMHFTPFILTLVMLCAVRSSSQSLQLQPASTVSLSGSVTFVTEDSPSYAWTKVAAIRHETTRNGTVLPLSKRSILGADSVPGTFPARGKHPACVAAVVTAQRVKGRTSKFEFPALPTNATYSLIAFGVQNIEDDWVDFTGSQPFGLYTPPQSSPCVPSAYSSSLCTEHITIAADARENVTDIHFTYQATHPLPAALNATVRYRHGEGRLERLKGITTLYLKGSAMERGYAHGYLLAPQIVDMVEFFLLQDMIRDVGYYTDTFLPALHAALALSPQARDGLEGIMAGLRASGASLVVPSLGRAVTHLDILALNVYSDSGAFAPYQPAHAPKPLVPSPHAACSQFVFWGNATSTGETVTGRNMDGEADIRHRTVTNFVMFVVDPSERGLARHVHFLWPGFLGASSGLNEHGFYMMEDAGCHPDSAIAPVGMPFLRDVISNQLMTQVPNPDTDPVAAFEAQMSTQKASTGGSCANGCIFVYAVPSNSCSESSSNAEHGCGFVYEGDLYGGETRVAGRVPPMIEEGIMATNHYYAYNAEPSEPEKCNGMKASFSSLWRYEAGKNRVESLLRAHRPGQRVGIDQAAVQGLLQTVAHGMTEHSIITFPDRRAVAVAVADPNGMWDAPYREYTPFTLDEIFSHFDLQDIFEVNYV